jgi:hypothetical protein
MERRPVAGPPFLRLGVDEVEAARLGFRGRTHRRRGDLIGVSIQRRPIVDHVATCPAEDGTTTDASVFGKRAWRAADSILLKQVLTGFPAAERAKVLPGDSLPLCCECKAGLVREMTGN